MNLLLIYLRNTTFYQLFRYTGQRCTQVRNLMKKILLIEDNANNATLIAKILKPHGYEITHAIDAMTGFWMAQQTWFDLVLLDMGLPDLHGTRVAGALQNLGYNRQIQIVAVTADTTTKNNAPSHCSRLYRGNP